MARAEIPNNVRQLIQRHVSTVQQVEILALLGREPERDWSAAEASRALRISERSCEAWLADFARAGLVERRPDGFRHATQGKQAQAAEDLVDCYSRRRLAVIESIYNKADTAIQSFSDAFRFRSG
jgi:DNA-binding MarR family transcriptional regulator